MSRFLHSAVMILSAVVVAVFPPPLSGAQPPPHISIQRVDVSGLPEIHVYLSVTDERGKSVIGLTDREITVACDGLAQPVTSFHSVLQGGEAMAVVLLFDRSGSIKTGLDETREAAAGFIRRLTDNDEVGIVTFDDRIRVDFPLARDRAAAEAAVRKITPGNNTVLFDAVGAGLAEIGNAKSKRSALIVLSDGQDTRSRATSAEAVAWAKAAGVAVFTVGFGSAVEADVLRTLAEETGGRFFSAARPEDLLALYQTIGEQLENQYHLVFRPAFGQDEAWHRMEIRVAPPGGGGGAAAEREFIATTGPGVSRAVLGGLERRVSKRRFILGAAVGAAFGLLFGFLLGLIVKLIRPDLRLRVAAFAGLMVLGAVLGALVGVLILVSD
ncbi:MAG: VWA domain-containing protein [Candidatus Aminicenantes bacterium]|nr:VWA domain-containing protein [Candidatus Aminicenantes bacterium]